MHVFVIGPFPPPVHGVSAINSALFLQLRELGSRVTVLDTAAAGLGRGWVARLRRLPRVLSALRVLLTTRDVAGGTCYCSASGGSGQVYEIVLVAVARMRGLSILIHHHSFAYLAHRSVLMTLLTWVAGEVCVHVTLSPRMQSRLQSLYPAVRCTTVISNAAFLSTALNCDKRRGIRTIGFLSNISTDKGIDDFLDLADRIRDDDQISDLRAVIAGPFQDRATARAVQRRLATLPAVQYVGPRYGAEKELFWKSIDLLVFPTRYANEAEPLTILEAMQHGIPVIAFGRGAIPELLENCGLALNPGADFVTAAMAQLKHWRANDAVFQECARGGPYRFQLLSSRSKTAWDMLIRTVVAAAGQTQPFLSHADGNTESAVQ